jgi:hypothetical protein
MIRTDATTARSLDKMATDATDIAHTDTDTDKEENTRETERDTGRQTQRDREKETREGGDGLVQKKKNPPKKTCTQK